MASIGASKAASAKSRIDEATTPTSITFDKTVVPMFVAEKKFGARLLSGQKAGRLAAKALQK